MTVNENVVFLFTDGGESTLPEVDEPSGTFASLTEGEIARQRGGSASDSRKILDVLADIDDYDRPVCLTPPTGSAPTATDVDGLPARAKA